MYRSPLSFVRSLLLAALLLLVAGAAARAASAAPSAPISLCAPFLPVNFAGMTATVHVTNGGTAPTNVMLQLYSTSGSLAATVQQNVLPAASVTFPLATLSQLNGAYSGVLSADQPLEAAVHLFYVFSDAVAVYRAGECAAVNEHQIGPAQPLAQGWESVLYVMNNSDTQAMVHLQRQAPNGNTSGAPVQEMVPAHGLGRIVATVPAGEEGASVYHVVAGMSNQIHVVLINQRQMRWISAHGPMYSRFVAVAAERALSFTAFHPLLRTAGIDGDAVTTILNVASLGADSGTMAAQIYPQGTASPIALMRALQPMGYATVDLATLTGSEAMPPGFSGSTVVSSNQFIVSSAAVLPGPNVHWSLDSYETGEAATRHLLTGIEKGNDRFSTLAVQNTSPTVASVTLKYFAANGMLTFTNPVVQVAPGSNRMFELRAEPGLPAGFKGAALVTADQPVVAAAETASRLVSRNVETVTVEGPEYAEIGEEVTLTATASPLVAWMPITYTWFAPENAPIIHVRDRITDTLALAFATSGFKSIQVNADNDAIGSAGTFHQLTVVNAAEPISETAPVTLTAVGTAGDVQAVVPAGAGATGAVVTLTMLPPQDAAAAGAQLGPEALRFLLETYENGERVPNATFATPLALTVRYGEALLEGVNEERLRLLLAIDEGWIDAGASCATPPAARVDAEANELTQGVCWTGVYRLDAEPYVNWLPSVRRGQ